MSHVVYHQFIWRRGGDSVQVTGSFRGWKDGVPMQKLADGSYVAYVQLPANSRIHYKYIVDRNWQYDPSASWEHDGYGNINNVLITEGTARSGSAGLPGGSPPGSAVAEKASSHDDSPLPDGIYQPEALSAEAATAMHEANAFSMALAHPSGSGRGDTTGMRTAAAGPAGSDSGSLAATMAGMRARSDGSSSAGGQHAARAAEGRLLIESALLDGGPVEVPEIARPFMQWATPAEVVAAVRSMRTTPPVPQEVSEGGGDPTTTTTATPQGEDRARPAGITSKETHDEAESPTDAPPDSPMGEGMPESPRITVQSLTGATGSGPGSATAPRPVARSEKGSEDTLGLKVAAGLDQIIGGGRVSSTGEMRNIKDDKARSNDLHVHMKEYGLEPVTVAAAGAAAPAASSSGGGSSTAPAEALQALRASFVEQSDSQAAAYKHARTAGAAGAASGTSPGAPSDASVLSSGRTTGRGAGGSTTMLSHVAATVRKEGKLVIAVVGLPARGKTYIARKLKRHLTWMGLKTEIYNVGNYRRKHIGAAQPAGFFDPSNREGVRLRRQMASAALEEMMRALQGDVDIAVFDATNSSRDRRAWLRSALASQFGDTVRLMFLESICTDEATIRSNVRETKLKSPDYQHMTEAEAVSDFLQRIAHYVKVYQPVDETEDVPYIKLVDVGRQIVANRVQGYLNSRIMFFLSNLHITPRPIWITRHGESQYNVLGRIGGDSKLSPRGSEYSRRLAEFMKRHYPDEKRLTVWTSTLRRTSETGQHLEQELVQWKQLDEIEAGVCDGMTYEAIAATMPDEYRARAKDKYNYRYPRGESYRDLTHRLEPVIMELMRQKGPVLIISHQATLRVLYAYLTDKPPSSCPKLMMPLHTLVQLTPKAYGCEEVRHELM